LRYLDQAPRLLAFALNSHYGLSHALQLTMHVGSVAFLGLTSPPAHPCCPTAHPPSQRQSSSRDVRLTLTCLPPAPHPTCPPVRLPAPACYCDQDYSSGADDEITLRENHAAFQRLWFKPRVLVNVAKIDLRWGSGHIY